jgi:hypothetical protein
MFYFIRRLQFSPEIDASYFKNPTKFLELNLSDNDQEVLHNYLTLSQRIRYKILTSFNDTEIFPITFFCENENSLEGFVCVGVRDVYDYMIKILSDKEYQLLDKQLFLCSKIMNFRASRLHLIESIDTDLNFSKVKKMWTTGQDIASDQSCQKIACL